jgi:hypothetical protein
MDVVAYLGALAFATLFPLAFARQALLSRSRRFVSVLHYFGCLGLLVLTLRVFGQRPPGPRAALLFAAALLLQWRFLFWGHSAVGYFLLRYRAGFPDSGALRLPPMRLIYAELVAACPAPEDDSDE